MDKLFEKIRNELSAENNYAYTQWLTENTPKRISGSGDDKKAAQYIADKFAQFGLESGVMEFEAYNSNPIDSEVYLTYPEQRYFDSLPCCHILSTSDQGEEYELVYIGAGSYEDYIGKNVIGKAVLLEVSYAPATPEKARIAAQMGVSAIICANWGEDGIAEQQYPCNRGLKSVWGNPTRSTFRDIPQVAGVSLTRDGGQYLKDVCKKNELVKVKIKARATRSWDMLSMPFGYIKGSEDPEQFVLVNGHIDAWEPGVTCNATGNGTILELARVLAKHKNEIKRSILFICWNGHEIAESAGSTWFIDQYWNEIEKNCIAGVNIDSTGLVNAEKYEATASRELRNIIEKCVFEVEGYKIDIPPLMKYGDQSFFGIGVPGVVGRMGLPEQYCVKSHGATLGWWNHTIKDSLDKCDKGNLKKDLDIACNIILTLCNSNVIDFDFSFTCDDVLRKVSLISEKTRGAISMLEVEEKVERLQALVNKINREKERLKDKPISDSQVKLMNQLLMRISRLSTSAFYTFCERVEQNSYAYTPMSNPIPYLYLSVEFAEAEDESEEKKLLYTEALRGRNRLSTVFTQIIELVELYLFQINCMK